MTEELAVVLHLWQQADEVLAEHNLFDTTDDTAMMAYSNYLEAVSNLKAKLKGGTDVGN